MPAPHTRMTAAQGTSTSQTTIGAVVVLLCLTFIIYHLEFEGWADAKVNRASVRVAVAFNPGGTRLPESPPRVSADPAASVDNIRRKPDVDVAAASAANAASPEFDLWSPWDSVNKKLNSSGAKVFITCTYNKGRSGHELKDVATPFIFSVMYGWTPCHGKWWKSKPVKMFNPALGLADCESYRAKDNQPPLTERLGATRVSSVVHQHTTYDGMTFEDMGLLKAKVDAALSRAKPDEAILVTLTKSTRVHMYQVYNWWRQGKMPHAVFEPVRRTLQARWFHYMNRVSYKVGSVERVPELPYLKEDAECQGNTVEDSKCIEYTPTDIGVQPNRDATAPGPVDHRPSSDLVVAAHFRRGDVKHMAAGEFTGPEFAQKMVDAMRDQLSKCKGKKIEVNIHTERRGAEDLTKRPGVKHVSRIFSKGRKSLL